MTATTLIRRILLSWCIVFGPLVAALVLNRWWHDGAVILANLWLFAFIYILTLRRQPCDYGSYADWWADRDNWRTPLS